MKYYVELLHVNSDIFPVGLLHVIQREMFEEWTLSGDEWVRSATNGQYSLINVEDETGYVVEL